MKVLLFFLLLCTSVHAQTWTPEMQSLAVKTEAEFGLPHGTCRAFALQESNYRPTAARVETGYFNEGSRYYRTVSEHSLAFATDHNVDFITERAYESISFGMFQIMGFNLRSLGDTNTVLSKLTLSDQFEYFGRFIVPLWKKYHSIAKVASCFNTGNASHSTAAYAVRVTKYQKQFSY